MRGDLAWIDDLVDLHGSPEAEAAWLRLKSELARGRIDRGEDKQTIVLEGGPHDGEILVVNAAMRLLEMPDFTDRRPAVRPDGAPGVLTGRVRYRDSGRADAAGRPIFAAEG